MDSLVVYFFVVSTFINVIMLVLRKYENLWKSASFSKFKPVLPVVLGCVGGALASVGSEIDLSMTLWVMGGGLAGSFSGTSYEIVKRFLEKKGGEL